MKYLLGIIVAVLAIALVYVTLSPPDAEQVEDGKVQISASFFPLADFAKNVGGDLVTVSLVVPVGAEAHDYSPSPQEIINLQQADLFLFNGADLDPWAEALVGDLESAGVETREIAEFVSLAAAEEEEDGDEHEEEEDEHGKFDPHIWLDPVLAREQVEVILDALSEIDPDNAQAYEDNATFYIRELSELNRAYETGLVKCESRDVIVAHDAFGYLGRRYNINFIAITGLSPHAEPSARTFGELQELAQEREIKYVFFETLTSPRLAEALANDIGAETLVLNPVEGLTQEETEAGENYISVMQNNLQNLQLAMGCS